MKVALLELAVTECVLMEAESIWKAAHAEAA